MAIEFHCTHCNKPLKTSDEKGGRQAKCPGCGGLIDIPSVDGQILDLAPFQSAMAPETSFPAESSPTTDMMDCPACAERIPSSSVRCQYCGIVLPSSSSGSRRLSGQREIRPFPPGEVLADAWRIFTERIGLAIGSLLVMGILSGVATLIGWMPFVIAQLLFDRGESVGAGIAAFIGLICFLSALAFSFWIQLGYLSLQLKIAREQPAQMGDLFTGRRPIFRMIFNSIIFGMMVSIGSMLCIVPGILMALMFWPYGHVLVDEDRPGLNSLSRAKDLTDGNWGSLFIVLIVANAAIMAGYCACGIGLIFAVPYANILYAVAYDRMSCQTDLKDIKSE